MRKFWIDSSMPSRTTIIVKISIVILSVLSCPYQDAGPEVVKVEHTEEAAVNLRIANEDIV